MRTIKVTVNNKGLGFAIGKNNKGETVFVKNGDLKNDLEINSVFIEYKGDRILSEILETYENNKLIQEKLDNDKLISTQLVDKVINRNQFVIKDKWVFPDNRILGLIDYLLNYNDLWINSKICLNGERSSYQRVQTFGITFQKAIDKLTKAGFSKARFYCDKRKDFSKDGVVAEMLANTYSDKNGLINLEVWQGVENINEVFYAHGLMNNEHDTFSHFDCAVIDYNIKDKIRLFEENIKIKSGHYKKLFRIDGTIKTFHIFELASRFFPLDNLIDEYFEIEKI
jgi:hypothetical protein